MFKEFCRICLETTNLHYIFEEADKNGNGTIAEKLQEISGMQITDSDEIPQFVCAECLQKIDYFIEFQSEIKSSHEYLQRVKWKVCGDTLEFEETDSVQYQDVHATSDGDFEVDIIEENKSELLEETTKTRELDGGDSISCHLSPRAAENPYKCDNSFVDSSDLKEPQRIRTEKKPFECKFCKKAFSQVDGLKLHLRLHTGEWPYLCDICEKPFKTQSPLTYHMRLHTSVRNFVCVTCNKGFKNKDCLNEHIENHARERPYECSLCGGKFAIAAYLNIHMETHNPESLEYVQTIKQKVCEDPLKIVQPGTVSDHDAEGIFNHIMAVVNKSESRKKSVKRRNLYKSNLISIKKRKNLQCTICKKTLSSKSRLTCHLRIHTGEKPYKCGYCEKSFAEAGNLKVHQRVHTGEKPLECKICGKRFTQGTGLKSHMRLHTGECPYECYICGQGFKTSTPVKHHIQREHTGERDFSCPTCDKAFLTRRNLNAHIKIHTGEKAYECSVCEKKFLSGYHLKRHMKVHTVGSSLSFEIVC